MALFDWKELRKSALGKVEEALMKLADDNLKNLGKDWLKSEAHRLIDGFIDKNYDKLLAGAHGKVRAMIDKIDGEVDVTPVGATAENPNPTPQAAVAPGAP